MPDNANKAVFLSYAREDSDAARRIADALRAFGVETWIDQSELRGGDAWDQNIRRQIKECALFVPIISAHTQARGEGYFRLEWTLAEERALRIAKGVPFIVPIVVDDTTEAGASVPDAFLRSQWTRLPKGVPSPQFVEQVERLLGQSRTPAPGTGAAAGEPSPPRVLPSKSGWRITLAAAVLALGVVWWQAARRQD
ncbi:MAG: toll/interleukin-1 receptor domain-containing protein [Verrucomicrobia bacterium]|nr:toll/interleukin-1 receptor domain-containing protein [Verrucomicrobiota bacterium]